MFEACALCGTDQNLEYCAMCKHYFCTRCKTRYPARVAAMMREKAAMIREKSKYAGDLIGDFLNFLGVK